MDETDILNLIKKGIKIGYNLKKYTSLSLEELNDFFLKEYNKAVVEFEKED